MVRKIAPFLLLPALLLGIAGQAFASGEGTSAMPFLKVGPSPRAAAMADAFTAISNDASAVSYNPAGMALVDKKEVMFSHTSWLEGVRNEYLTAVVPVSEELTFGGSINYMFTDAMTQRNEYGEDTGQFRESDGYVSFAAAYRPDVHFSYGGSLKVLRQSIATYSGMAAAVSGGVLYTTEYFNAGAGIDNAGTKMAVGDDAFPLPLTFKAGVAVQPIRRTFISCDGIKARDRKGELRLGAEAYVPNLLGYSDAAIFLRGGMRTLKDDNTGPGLTFGLGLDFTIFSLDYAFAPYGDLGNTHRVAFTYRFGYNRLLTESRSWLLR